MSNGGNCYVPIAKILYGVDQVIYSITIRRGTRPIAAVVAECKNLPVKEIFNYEKNHRIARR